MHIMPWRGQGIQKNKIIMEKHLRLRLILCVLYLVITCIAGIVMRYHYNMTLQLLLLIPGYIVLCGGACAVTYKEFEI